MNFQNRLEAAELLIERLSEYRDKNPLVLGIPRGAIPMAKIIAEGLNGELGAILVHKLPMIGNEEFAIGSIGLSGNIQLMPYTDSLHIPKSYIEDVAREQLQLLRRRQIQYGLKNPEYKNRIVIIVDDGIATGATTLSAIFEVKSQNPKEVIVAAAVSSKESANKIRSVVDKLVVLQEPEFFFAVGQFFNDFSQVSDEEVIDIFRTWKKQETKN